MFKGIWNIIRKECSRFFKDWRLVFAAIILPSLLFYGLYSIAGSETKKALTISQDYVYSCHVQNVPDSFAAVFDALGTEIVETTDVEASKEDVREKDVDMLVIFPGDFDEKMAKCTPDTAPNIEVYYNSDKIESYMIYNAFLEAADQFETSIVNILDINRGVEQPDLAPFSSLMLSFLPAMIMMILFTDCLSVVPESISGEKERGTIATLLVTPVSRKAIAIGKICSLSLFALLAAGVNFLGVMLSMPKMGDSFDMSFYTAAEYGGLLWVMVTTVLFATAIMAVISAYAKSVKEATATAGALMLLSSLLSMLTSFGAGFGGIIWRFVPIMNSALCLRDIFLLEYAGTDILITGLSNLVYTLGLVVVLAKMFNSEKVMFRK